MTGLQSIRHSTWIWTVPFVLALVLGLLIGYWRAPRSSVRPSVTLRVIYQDNVTDVAGTVVNGKEGSNVGFHQGSATYFFKNELPIPVKLMFPPIGYTSGSVPITPQVVDVTRMPTFCQQPQVVQLEPFAEQSFESSYTITGTSPVEHFVFGCPRQGNNDGVFVGEVASTPEIRPAHRTLEDSSANKARSQGESPPGTAGRGRLVE